MTFEDAYDYLFTTDKFTQEELSLVCCGWGERLEVLNIICQVRYGMNVEQLKEEEEEEG